MPKSNSKQRRRNMTPDPHDEHTWKLAALLHEHAPMLYAFGAAIVTAALKTYSETGRITGRDVSEWLICGIFVASSRPVWTDIGLNDSYGAFLGVVAGMLGARVLRVTVEALFNKLVSRIGGK